MFRGIEKERIVIKSDVLNGIPGDPVFDLLDHFIRALPVEALT
jgi:hypothetical protein